MAGLKRLHIIIPELLYYTWIRERRIDYGQVTERIKSLIEGDCKLSDDEKTKLDLENELKKLEKKKIDTETQEAIIRMRINELNEEENEQKNQEIRDKARLKKEMNARGL